MIIKILIATYILEVIALFVVTDDVGATTKDVVLKNIAIMIWPISLVVIVVGLFLLTLWGLLWSIVEKVKG